MRCTVAVCTRSRPELLARCLASLKAQSHASFEILVIDNGPNDPQTQEIAKDFAVRYVAEPTVGLSRSRNRALCESDSEILAFLDDDAVAEPNWVGNIISSFEDQSVAFATSRVIDSVTDANGIVRIFTRKDGTLELINRYSDDWFVKVNFGWMGDGHAFALRAQVAREIGGFSHALGRGASIDGSEEHHLFFLLIKNGWTGVYNPEALVRHLPVCNSTADAKRRILKDSSNVSAYFTKLLAEEPAHRLDLFRYLLRNRNSRPRPAAIRNTARSVSRWNRFLAMVAGQWCYVRLQRDPSRDMADVLPTGRLNSDSSLGH